MPNSAPKSGLAPSPNSTTAATGCENCRELHLKCGRELPTCRRCKVAGRSCRQTGIKIRQWSCEFRQRQRWVKIPTGILMFHDETEDVCKEVQTGSDESLELCSPTAASQANSALRTASQHTPTESLRVSAEDRGGSGAGIPSPPADPGSPTDRFIQYASEPYAELKMGFREAWGPQIYLAKPVWPLTDPEQARLYKHFVQKLSIWLDLCDANQTFETKVARRASTCPIVLYAIFALAARHLSNIDPLHVHHLLSNRYHEECLKYMIPMTTRAEAILDENLFAATIILRVLEEMEVKTSGQDHYSYLLGIKAFLKGSEGDRFPIDPGSVSAAAFWVGLRQEIYISVMNSSPVEVVDNSTVRRLVKRSLDVDPENEFDLANRAVVHCADVLNFCFGDLESPAGASRAAARWDELMQWNRAFSQQWPKECAPVFCTTSRRFPEIWYRASCHVIGVQHHILAELFLIRYDPKVPRAGGGLHFAEKERNQRIHDGVRRVCGIGLGNQWTPPGMFTSCMAIAAFGSFFHDRLDQEEMLGILKMTEHDHARPTEAVQLQMMKIWGWTSQINPDESEEANEVHGGVSQKCGV